MDQIRPQIGFKSKFPVDDGEAQRFILSDLLQKLCSAHETQVLGHPKYHRLEAENEEAKLKLREVTRKCDQMLAIMRTKGYRTRTRTKRTESPSVLYSLGTRMKELNGLARRMKRDYREFVDDSDDSHKKSMLSW
jgi:hypothetical protein